jgi:hypothetical protein
MALTEIPIELSSTPSIVDGGNATAITIDSSENVGIGTASPRSILDLDGGSETQLRLQTTNSGSAASDGLLISLDSSTNAKAYIWNYENAETIFGTNNAERMRIDSSGNVGIGGAPASLLDVFSTGEVISTVRSTSTSGARQATLRLNVPSTGGDDPAGRVQFTYGTGYTVAGSIEMSHTNTAMKFLTGTTERMRIDASGSVGIGTSSPSASKFSSTPDGVLNVSGNKPVVYLTEEDETDSNVWMGLSNEVGIIGNTGTALVFRTGASTATEHMRIDSSGNVGIGTDSPSQKLHVDGTNTVLLVTEDSEGDATLRLADSQGALSQSMSLSYDTGSSNALKFIANGTAERMRIDSSGNVQVGFSSYSSLGSVNTGCRLSHDGQTNALARGSNGVVLSFYSGNGGAGNISVTTNTAAYNTSSDQRLKENIADADDAGNKIDAIQVRKFDWKADGSHQDYGMIAQELQAVAPEAVSVPEDSEEMIGVDYSKLVPMLVKEIQSLRNRVAQLEE